MSKVVPSPRVSDQRPPGVVARGAAMGLADAVPGVSGGTMALLLGIHPRLVRAIALLRPRVLRDLLGPERGAAWRSADLGFLVLLGLGLASGLLLGAKVLVVALHHEPTLMAALLLGLVVGGVRAPARRVTWDAGAVGFALLFGFLGFFVTVLNPVAVPATLWFLPLAGAVAAIAMILPGISGAYLLLLMGLYEPVLAAVAALDVAVVALVGAGAAVGLLAFSRVLHHLLGHHPSSTHAAMVGLLVGSLGRLWPWRSEAGFAEGAPAAPVWPGVFEVALAAFVGFLVVRVLEAATAPAREPSAAPLGAASPSETAKGT